MNFKYFNINTLLPLILILLLIFQPISNWIEQSLNDYESLKVMVSYIDSLSTIGMITVFLTFINYVGWKWKIFRWLIDVPDLNGRYTGKIVSSYIDPNTQIPVTKDCVLEIKQTASSVHIFAYYGDLATNTVSSRSYTVSEQLIKEQNGFFLLYYIFTSEPDTMSLQLNNHDGTAKLQYYPDTKVLEGGYYNKRLNYGTMKVTFVEKKLLGRLKR